MYKSEHLPDGESFGEGDLLFSSPHCKPPPSLSLRTPCILQKRWYGWPRSPGVRLVYVVQAAHNGMIKGRTSSPTHAYVPFTARISNPSSGVRVSATVVLRVIFRAVCRVFSVLCGSLLRGYAYLWKEEREYLRVRVLSVRIVCSGSLCSAVDAGLDLFGKLFQHRHDVLVARGRDPAVQALKKGVALCCGECAGLTYHLPHRVDAIIDAAGLLYAPGLL